MIAWLHRKPKFFPTLTNQVTSSGSPLCHPRGPLNWYPDGLVLIEYSRSLILVRSSMPPMIITEWCIFIIQSQFVWDFLLQALLLPNPHPSRPIRNQQPTHPVWSVVSQPMLIFPLTLPLQQPMKIQQPLNLALGYQYISPMLSSVTPDEVGSPNSPLYSGSSYFQCLAAVSPPDCQHFGTSDIRLNIQPCHLYSSQWPLPHLRSPSLPSLYFTVDLAEECGVLSSLVSSSWPLPMPSSLLCFLLTWNSWCPGLPVPTFAVAAKDSRWFFMEVVLSHQRSHVKGSQLPFPPQPRLHIWN